MFKHMFGIVVLTYALATAAKSGVCEEKLIFSDDFNFLDFSTWQHEITMGGGGNWEFEMYWNNRSNSFTKDGALHIRPTLTSDRIGMANLINGYQEALWGGEPANLCTSNAWYGCERMSGGGGNYLNPIQSARLRSVNSFSFKYGKIEFKAKIPSGDWLWPAMWLLPKHQAYGNWPASGEIDIMESRGNENYPDNIGGANTFGSTLHWGPGYPFDNWAQTTKQYKHTESLSKEWHTYGMKWTEDRLFTYFDDESNVVLDVDMSKESFWDKGKFPSTLENPWATSPNKNAPFDQEFYIVLNVAAGGTGGYFPDGQGDKVWNDKDPHAVNGFFNARGIWYPTWKDYTSSLRIDSIKVWSESQCEKEEKQEPYFME